MLIKRVRARTECSIWEKQCGFRQDSCTNCLSYSRCVRSISQMGNMYSGHLWIWKRHMIRSIGMVCGRYYECMELQENC